MVKLRLELCWFPHAGNAVKTVFVLTGKFPFTFKKCNWKGANLTIGIMRKRPETLVKLIRSK